MEVSKVDFQQQDVGSDESIMSSITAKFQRSPFLMAGITSLITVCGIGAYKWKTRKIPVQLFLIQLRVAAQGAAIGCLTVGMIYHMLKDFVFDKKERKTE